jgi:hypothetical protein
MYRWVVFLHVASGFVFMGAHGVSIAVTLVLRQERDPARLRALLDLSRSVQMTSNIALLILITAGVAAGFMGQWWRMGWIWASLGLLIATLIPGVIAIRFFAQIRRALGLPTRRHPASEPASMQELDTLLSGYEPLIITVPGILILAAIIWLMVLKPF